MKLTKTHSQDAQKCAGTGQARVLAWDGGIDVWSGLADENQKEDEGDDPRILLIGVNDGVAEYRDKVGDNRYDNNSNGNGHLVI